MPTASAVAVAIHVDGGHRHGFGHVGRCLALCEEIGEAAAFTTSDPGLTAYLTARGARLVRVDVDTPVVVLDRAAEVGLPEVQRFQAHGSRVVLVDDAGPARTVADLVVDPPTGPSWPPASGPRLGGFEHVLLRREIRAARSRPTPGVGVLVSMGGSDPEGLTPRLAQALRQAGIEMAVALGPGYRGPQIPEAVAPDTWPNALAGASLVVTRFGHTLLEAAHLGVPAVVVVSDGRDRRDASAFAAHGTIRWLESTAPEAVADAAAAMIEHDEERLRMSRRGRQLVDGLGAARVAAAVMELT